MPSQEILNTHLETILKGNHNRVFQNIDDFLEENSDVPQKCSKLVWETLSELLHKAIETPAESLPQITVILRVFQHLAGFPEQEDGLNALLDFGLGSLIAECLITALHGVRESVEDDINKFYEDVLETITAISDHSQKAKKIMVETFCDRLLQIVGHANFRPHIKIEAIKSVNSLMDGCTQESRDNLNNKISHKQQVQKIGTLLVNAGDYEFQAGIVESLFRLTNKTIRTENVQHWLPEESLQTNYLAIRDSCFEGDCRSFLNILNKRCKGNPRVISLPCNKAALGQYELEKPEDGNYTEFWVDFNSGSERISLFCNQQSPDLQEDEEAMWETVSIWKSIVKSYNVTAEKLGVQNVQIVLYSEARDLITFGPDNLKGNKVTLKFDAKYDVMEALILTLGIEKCARHSADNGRQASLISSQKSVDTCGGTYGKKVSQAEHPVYVSSETDALVTTNATEDVNKPFKEPTAPAPINKYVIPASQESGASTPVQKIPGNVQVTPRRKCSIPEEPMRTPTITLVTEDEQKAHTISNRGIAQSEKAVHNKSSRQPTNEPAKVRNKIQSYQSSVEEDSEAIPNSQTRSSRRRKVSQSIPYNPPVPDAPDTIPSSCPEESVVPDSQQSACIPETNLEGSADTSKPKNQRKEEIAALKDKLSATDPNYTNYPANKYKLSNTPALSTVTEESPNYRPSLESKKGTPTSRTTTTSITPIEEEERDEPSQTTSPVSKKSGKLVPPDSTCNQPETTKKAKGKRGKTSNQEKAAAVDERKNRAGYRQDISPADLPPPKRTTRSKKEKVKEEEHAEQEGSNVDEETPIPTSQYSKQIVAEEKAKRTNKGTHTQKKEIMTNTASPDDEVIDVIPASFDPEVTNGEKPGPKKKMPQSEILKSRAKNSGPKQKNKKTVSDRRAQPRIQSGIQDDDPYLFSDDDDDEREKTEIVVGKFYAPKGRKNTKSKNKKSPPNPKNNQKAGVDQRPEKPKDLKSSINTASKSAKTTAHGYDEEFPDLVVENDSYSEYREYEYKFFKSRNNTDTKAAVNKTPKQNRSMNLASKEPNLLKSRSLSREKNDKGSLTFTSPIAGAPKIKNARSPVTNIQDTTSKAGNRKGRQSRSKKKQPIVTVDELPTPEVTITRLDTPESPISSPVRLNNIDVVKLPELRPLVSELKKVEKSKATNPKVTSNENEKVMVEQAEDKTEKKTHKQKIMEKIKQKMKEASGDREQLQNALGKYGKTNSSHAKKKPRKVTTKEVDIEIEDSDDPINNTSMEVDRDADVSSNAVDESVDSFANLCKSLVRGATRRPLRVRKNVTYTEMSESDFGDEQSTMEERKKVIHKKDVKEKAEVENRKKKHRGVFSETDDGISCRSEVSWLGSTARKKKPKAARVYEHSPKQKHPFIRQDDQEESYEEQGIDQTEQMDEVDEQMDESYEPPPPVKALAADRKKRKMPKSPQQTEDETSEVEEDRYYRGTRKRRPAQPKQRSEDSDKENRPPEESLTMELPMEAEIPFMKTPAVEKSGKSRQKTKETEDFEEPITGSQITRDVTSRFQQILKETSMKIIQSDEIAPKPTTKKPIQRILKENTRRGSNILDDAIERFRHDISTTGPLGDISPITVDEEISQRSGSNESHDGLDLKSQQSYVSHISSLKTPKTPARRNFGLEDDVMSQKSAKSTKSAVSLKSAKSAASTKSNKQQKRSVNLEENVKSGPSKRRKVETTECAEAEEDDNDETDSQSSQFQPRRLFTPEERLERQRKRQQRHQFSGETSYRGVDLEEEPMMLSPATTSALALNINSRMLDFEDDDRLADGVSFMIKSFGGEIQKNMMTRKQQLHVLTKGLIKNTEEQLAAFWTGQTSGREKVMERFRQDLEGELAALEKDNDELKDAEEKVMEFFISQFKTIQGCLVSQQKRLGNLQKIQSTFSNDMVDLEQIQELQQTKVKDILRKNMKDLQKRILLSTQQQEISNVKRTLQSLFM